MWKVTCTAPSSCIGLQSLCHKSLPLTQSSTKEIDWHRIIRRTYFSKFRYLYKNCVAGEYSELPVKNAIMAGSKQIDLLAPLCLWWFGNFKQIIYGQQSCSSRFIYIDTGPSWEISLRIYHIHASTYIFPGRPRARVFIGDETKIRLYIFSVPRKISKKAATPWRQHYALRPDILILYKILCAKFLAKNFRSMQDFLLFYQRAVATQNFILHSRLARRQQHANAPTSKTKRCSQVVPHLFMGYSSEVNTWGGGQE